MKCIQTPIQVPDHLESSLNVQSKIGPPLRCGLMDVRYAKPPLLSSCRYCQLDSQVEDLEWFGFDPCAPTTDDEGLTTVVVDDVVIEIEDRILDQIRNYSNSFGNDLYQDTLSFLVNVGVE